MPSQIPVSHWTLMPNASFVRAVSQLQLSGESLLRVECAIPLCHGTCNTWSCQRFFDDTNQRQNSAMHWFMRPPLVEGGGSSGQKSPPLTSVWVRLSATMIRRFRRLLLERSRLLHSSTTCHAIRAVFKLNLHFSVSAATLRGRQSAEACSQSSRCTTLRMGYLVVCGLQLWCIHQFGIGGRMHWLITLTCPAGARGWTDRALESSMSVTEGAVLSK